LPSANQEVINKKRKIDSIIKRRILTVREPRFKCQKNMPFGTVPVAKSGSVLFGIVFVFTAVDIVTKECDVLLPYSLKMVDCKVFLD